MDKFLGGHTTTWDGMGISNIVEKKKVILAVDKEDALKTLGEWVKQHCDNTYSKTTYRIIRKIKRRKKNG